MLDRNFPRDFNQAANGFSFLPLEDLATCMYGGEEGIALETSKLKRFGIREFEAYAGADHVHRFDAQPRKRNSRHRTQGSDRDDADAGDNAAQDGNGLAKRRKIGQALDAGNIANTGAIARISRCEDRPSDMTRVTIGHQTLLQRQALVSRWREHGMRFAPRMQSIDDLHKTLDHDETWMPTMSSQSGIALLQASRTSEADRWGTVFEHLISHSMLKPGVGTTASEVADSILKLVSQITDRATVEEIGDAFRIYRRRSRSLDLSASMVESPPAIQQFAIDGELLPTQRPRPMISPDSRDPFRASPEEIRQMHASIYA